MTDFARYSPSSWVDEDGFLVRAPPEHRPQPRPSQTGTFAAVLSITLSVLISGVADHGKWATWRGSLGPEPAPVSTPPATPAVVAEFEQLVTQWRAACSVLSSTTRRTSHPAFRRIVGMGRAAVPLLLANLDGPGDWDIALTEILGEDPVPASARGDRDATVRAWRAWAVAHGWTNGAGQPRRA